MKNTLIASALIALSLAASGNVLAQRDDHRNDRGHQQYGERYDNDRHHNDRHARNDRHDRHDGPHGKAKHRRDDARYYHRDDRRGGGPRHDLRRGHHLSKEYRHDRYVVSDWRGRHLSAPPRGHHWVRAGNDYVLAAIATGLIAQVLLSN
jgi:Ni/Co efflux regulator RcnB